jgi:hypothetical protein
MAVARLLATLLGTILVCLLPPAIGEADETCSASALDVVVAGLKAAHAVPARSITDARERIVYLSRTMDQIDVTQRILSVCGKIALNNAQLENSIVLSEALDRLKYAALGEVAPAFIGLSLSATDAVCSAYLKDLALTYLQSSRSFVDSRVIVLDGPALRSTIQIGAGLIDETASTLGVNLDGPPPSPSIRIQSVTVSPRCEALVNGEIPSRLHSYGLK